MRRYEKDAIVDYLEFGLVQLVQEFEQHVHHDAVPELYDGMYRLLLDIQTTIDIGSNDATTDLTK